MDLKIKSVLQVEEMQNELLNGYDILNTVDLQ
jgi:hypothetical protein